MCLCCEAEDYGCSLLTKLALTNTLVYKYRQQPNTLMLLEALKHKSTNQWVESL